jgi:hypothetical protein
MIRPPSLMHSIRAEWAACTRVEKAAILLTALAVVASVLLSLANYPVIGDDSDVHPLWLDQFTRMVDLGVAYPRWLPDSFAGFGAATFYFYPPLPFWVASLLRGVYPFQIDYLYNLLSCSAGIVSVGTAWLFLRGYSASKLWRLTGALLYGFATYRFADVFIRNALGETWALIFLPLLFIERSDAFEQVAILALAWLGMLLCNLPMAALAAIAVAIRIVLRRSFREAAYHALAAFVSSLVAAIYLLPALSLRSLIHSSHLWDIYIPGSPSGIIRIVQPFSNGHLDWLSILVACTLLAGIAIIFRTFSNPDKRLRPWCWIALFCILFQMPGVALLWKDLAPFRFVQFSWRLNGLLLLAIVIFVASGPQSTRAFLAIFLSIVTLLGAISISRHVAETIRVTPNPYRIDAPEYAPRWTSNDLHEVIGIVRRRSSDPPALLLGLTMPGDSMTLLSRTPREWRFFAKLSRSTPVRFHHFYWPYWKAYADSTEIALSPDPNGFATGQLAAGHFLITLKLIPSQSETIGGTLSIAGSILLFILFAVASYRSITIRRESISPPETARKT